MPLSPLLLALVLLGETFAPTERGNDPVLTLHPNQPSFGPGETACVHVQGLPNTLTVIGIDTDPGPVMFPFGPVQLGLSPAFVSLTTMTGDSGCAEWCCSHDCDDPMFGVRLYVQAIQFPAELPPRTSNPLSMIWEDPTGSCEREDLCMGGGVKPQVLTMRYTGEDCSATSHAQDPAKVFCSGDPAMTPLVHVVAHDPPLRHVWFEGDVPLDGTFELDATLAGATRLKGDTLVEIYDAGTGALLQSIEFHTSCSEPLRVGDQFGSLELLGMIVE